MLVLNASSLSENFLVVMSVESVNLEFAAFHSKSTFFLPSSNFSKGEVSLIFGKSLKSNFS